MLLSWNIYIAEHFFSYSVSFSFKWHFLAASEGTIIVLEYEDFSDIPMIQDWGQSTLKLHVAESTILISTNWIWRGGVQTRRQKKTALTTFFCLFVLCCPQPINRGVPMVLFQRGSIIFQGVHLFQEGGGPNVNFYNFYRNPYITCNFLSPLWTGACIITFIHPVHPC